MGFHGLLQGYLYFYTFSGEKPTLLAQPVQLISNTEVLAALYESYTISCLTEDI
jgi:hypothetical protein